MVYRYLKKLTDYISIGRDPVAWARKQGVSIGDNCRFIGLKAGTFGSEPYLITLGNHVTLAYGVMCITHDGGVWVMREEHPDIDVIGRISIGNNVFIGINTIILPSVKIGDNVVIGAGSVVTRSIPSNVVACGAPARVIKGIDEYKNNVIQKSVVGMRELGNQKKRQYLEANVVQP